MKVLARDLADAPRALKRIYAEIRKKAEFV
jgi:hypothetical protein